MVNHHNTINPSLNHWYPVGWGRGISPKKPIRVLLFGKRIVLFRNELGFVSALPDRCSHRLAPLSKGKMVNGFIQCPYHGWQFSGKGECVNVPGLCEEKQNCKVRNLHPYKVQEKHGIVWINLGEGDLSLNSEPPNVPFYEDSSYLSFHLDTTNSGEIMTAIENLLDATHTHFVHNHLIRTDQVSRKKVKAVVRPKWNGVEVEYQNENTQSGIISRLFDKGNTTGFGRFLAPSTAQLEYKNEEGTKLILTAYFSPVDQNQVRAFIVVSHRKHRLIPGFILNYIMKALFRLGMKQDGDIIKKQSENAAAFKDVSFISTELDVVYPSMFRIFKEASEGTFDPSKIYPEKCVSIYL